MGRYTRWGALGVGVVCLAVAPAMAQVRQFDLPAQPMPAAISQFGFQAGVQVAASRDFTQGRRSAAVQGMMTAEQALARMLQGTGLRAEQSGPGTYILVHAGAMPIRASAPVQTTPIVASDTTEPPTPDAATNAPPAQDIVVTGLRASLQSAQSLKRQSGQIVDSIVADDIGKLPDRNVAEALQRISGIQIQRSYGEGSSIAIRGLTQIRTELNGRDIFTASGVDQLNLEDVPSELLAGVDVYKNPTAANIEGQLSGVVDFRTRKPFDFKASKIVVSAGDNYYDLKKKNEPSASILVSDRWNTSIGEIGFLANVSFERTAFRDNQISTEPFYTLDQTTAADAATAALLGRSGQTTTLPHGAGFNDNLGNRRRLGMDAALQWRPASNLEATAEVFHNDFKFQTHGYAYFAYTSTAAIEPLPGAPFTYAPNGDFQSGTFENVPVNSNTVRTTRDAQTTDGSLHLKWTPTSNLTLQADGQYVASHSQTSLNLVIFNATAPTMFQDLRGSLPIITIGPAGSMTDPANYTNGAYIDGFTRSDGEEKAARLDADYRFDGSFLTHVRAGFRFSDRSNAAAQAGNRYIGLSGAITDYTVYNLPGFYRGQANVGSGLVAFPLSVIDDYQGTHKAVGVTTDPAYLPSGADNQRRRTYAGYVEASFDAPDFALPFDGNIGGRLVRTEESTFGYYQQTPIVIANGVETTGDPSYAPIGFSSAYTKFLPSANVRFHLTPTLQARLAASANLSRPTFDQINPSLTLTEPGSAQVNQLHLASGGNPYLKPMTSRNLDASLEWYFAKNGYVALNGFYKRIHGYIQTALSDRTVTFPDGNSYLYSVTSYTNAATAKVKGFEAQYQQFFSFLPGFLSGTGLQANFTYVDSSAPSPATNGPVTQVPLEQLSKYSYNLIGLYDYAGISVRIAYNWRSKYVYTTAGSGTGNLPIFNKAFGQIDASVGYQLNDHLSFLIDARNINNARTDSYFGIITRPRTSTISDRRISGTIRLTL